MRGLLEPTSPLGTSLYHLLPVPFQNAALSLWGICARHERYGGDFERRLAALRESEWWSAAEISCYQNEKVRSVVTEAYASVPAYRARMDAYGLKPADISGVEDLARLPILTKADVRAEPKSFLDTRYRKSRLVVNHTGGTTGTPLIIYLTPEARRFQWAVWWRHRSRFGLHPGDRSLMFGFTLRVLPRDLRLPIWRSNVPLNQVYLSGFHLTPETIPGVMEWLNTQEFVYFNGFPTAMYVLADYMREHGLSLDHAPRCVVTGADALLPKIEQTLGAAFNAPVTDQYGSAEACGNLARCEHGRYHLDAEFCAIELLPVEGSPDPRLRRMIFTGFSNPAMPFLRYDQGDLAWVSEGPCPCGRQTMTIDRIDGRTDDFIHTPDGRIAFGMSSVFGNASHIVEAQIRQDDICAIDVLLVTDNEFSGRDKRVLDQSLRNQLGDALQIRYHRVDSIPRAKNGKFRAVISSLSCSSEGEAQVRAAVKGDPP